MTSKDVLTEVDRLLGEDGLGYHLTPTLYPYSVDPPEITRDMSYTAYIESFTIRQMADCVEHQERLIVDTWRVAEGRFTQEAYREQILAARDEVLDALLTLADLSGSRLSGSFNPTVDGLVMRTRFDVPVVVERPHGA